MAVLRIVANLPAERVDALAAFYRDLFGLEVVMDLGWIMTLASPARQGAQLSVMREGGSGTDVPDLSIEVDDLAEVLDRAHAQGVEIAYGPVDEPWGVRRFFLRDPAGRLVNVLAHSA